MALVQIRQFRYFDMSLLVQNRIEITSLNWPEHLLQHASRSLYNARYLKHQMLPKRPSLNPLPARSCVKSLVYSAWWTADNLFHNIWASHQLLLLNLAQYVFVEDSPGLVSTVWLFFPYNPLLTFTLRIPTIHNSILPVLQCFTLVLATILDAGPMEAPSGTDGSVDVLVGVDEKSTRGLVCIQGNLAVIAGRSNLCS